VCPETNALVSSASSEALASANREFLCLCSSQRHRLTRPSSCHSPRRLTVPWPPTSSESGPELYFTCFSLDGARLCFLEVTCYQISEVPDTEPSGYSAVHSN